MNIEELVAKKLGERKGLRRRFFLTVVLPPLVPLTVLGILGSLTLSGIIKNSLLDQLERASGATAARAEREFSIRETVLKRTGEDVYDLYEDRAACLAEISRIFPNAPLRFDQESSIIDNPACEPFLAEFARRNTELRNVYTRYASSFFGSSGLPAEASNEFNRIYSSAVNVEFERRAQDKFTTFASFFPETEEILVAGKDQTISEYKKTDNASLMTAENKTAEGVSLVVSGERSFALVSYALAGEQRKVLALYDVVFLQPTLEAAPRASKEDNILITDSFGVTIVSLLNEPEGDLISRESGIAGTPWRAVITSPSALVLAPLRQAQLISSLAVLISLIVSLIVGFFFVSSATKAIRRLLTGALTFAQGKFDQKIYLASGDELQTLAETMNEMAVTIKEAQDALIEKSKEFIYIATHELKAPLTAIIGYLSMIVDDGLGKVDKQAGEFITQAYGSTVALRNLIGDLLDIARLEAKKEQFDIKPLDITSVTRDIIDMQAITAKQRGITINYGPGADIPKVSADQEKLRIILTNFISNAIKYNLDKGTVTISHKIEDDGLTTTVADNGLGIPKEQQGMMFSKFFRVKGKDRANISGTGLGLYVTKQYIEKMGGRVWFESEPGKGTSFHFTLPISNGGTIQVSASRDA